MIKLLLRAAFLCCVTGTVAVLLCSPGALSDENAMLKAMFAEHFLGVLLLSFAIGGLLAVDIHWYLDRMCAIDGVEMFLLTRKSLKRSLLCLLAAIPAALALGVIKGVLPATPMWSAGINTLATLMIVIDCLILVDLILSAYYVRRAHTAEAIVTAALGRSRHTVMPKEQR